MISLLIAFALAAPGDVPETEPSHDKNPVFRSIIAGGLTIAGSRIELPKPRFRDGDTPDVERATLSSVTGSDKQAAEFLRDSVAAPFVLETKDVKVEGGVVRRVDLWFAVHSALERIEPKKAPGSDPLSQTVEAGNMRFTTASVPEESLEALGIALGTKDIEYESYMHATARLLDRIGVEVTDHSTASRSERSWLLAARTDPRFDAESKLANRWYPIVRKGAGEERGEPERYVGGASYVKISELKSSPGTLVVEGHFAFFEPKAWFDGAPILRSKFGLIAQDRIRALRRELAKSQRPGANRTESESKGR